jgi:hypothetical protein
MSFDVVDYFNFLRCFVILFLYVYNKLIISLKVVVLENNDKFKTFLSERHARLYINSPQKSKITIYIYIFFFLFFYFKHLT